MTYDELSEVFPFCVEDDPDTIIDLAKMLLFRPRCPGPPHRGHASTDWSCPIPAPYGSSFAVIAGQAKKSRLWMSVTSMRYLRMMRPLTFRLGWDGHGHARRSHTYADKWIGHGNLQDAENCGYHPVILLTKMPIDEDCGDRLSQFHRGHITLMDGIELSRGGTLNSVWAVTKVPGLEE